jgi:hypothetical protein
MTQNARRKTLIALTLIAAPTLIYFAALLFDPGRTLVLWERGPVMLAQLLPLVVGLVAYAALAFTIAARIGEALTRRQTVALLAFVFLSGVLLQTAATAVVEPYPLRGLALRQYSDFTGGYFTVGARVDDLGAWLGRFAQEMESYNVHAERHPPGLPIIFWLGTQLFTPFPALADGLASWLRPLACFDLRAASLNSAQIASGLFGIVVETVAAWLVPVAMFFFVRRVSNDRAAAFAALLYPLAPGALMWASQWDRSFGLFAMVGLIFVERLLALSPRGRGGTSPRELGEGAVSAFALGLTLFLGVLMSFGNLPIVMLCGLYAVARIWQMDRFRSLPLRFAQGLVVLFGFASVWLAMIAFTGFDVIGTYNTAMRIHLELDRPFWPFVLWHAWDIFTFVGLPLVAIALLLTWRQAPALTFAWVATLAAQCLLHVARGETGRVWMYFAPVIAALAGMWLASTLSPRGRGRGLVARMGHEGAWLGVLAVSLLVAQGIAHIGLLRVIGYGVDPITVPNATLPTNLTPANIRFEPNGEVQLLGYTLKPTLAPGESTTLDLYWQHAGAEPLPIARKVFVHVADTPEDQNRIAKHDGRPANWTLPTTCWLPGQVIHDPHPITVDANAKPGEYFVLIGLYDEFSGERAFVHTAQVAVANAVALPERVKVE